MNFDDLIKSAGGLASQVGGVLNAFKGTPAAQGTPAAKAVTTSFNWKPWAMGGAAVVLLFVVVRMFKK